LDEILLAGHLQEPSKKSILKAINRQEELINETNEETATSPTKTK